jgi:subtilisin family serine protease
MSSRHKILLLVAATVLSVSPAAGVAAAQAYRGAPTDEHVFAFARIPDDFAARVAAAGGTVVRTHEPIGVAVAAGLSDVEAGAIAGGARVARDVVLQWQPVATGLAASVVELSDPVGAAHDPTDAAFFPLQWNMHIIDADEAWNAGFRGNPNVVVAVIDSGIDPFHADLQGLVDFATSVAFVPSLTGPPAWVDDRFHGTHVAGSVVTNGIGTSGVAPHTRLMAVKVLDVNGAGSFADIIGGIMHAAENGADVINLSLGVPGGIPKNLPGAGILNAAVNNAINYAHRAGVLVVSAAGNEAIDMQHAGNALFTPCANGAGICVSATGPLDELAAYSNYGAAAIDVSAPGGNFDGVDVAATTVLSPCSTRSVLVACGPLSYLFAEGTSMAAPHVAGAAALLDAQANGVLTSAQLRSGLQQGADDLGKPGADPAYGKGRINVCAAVGCQ